MMMPGRKYDAGSGYRYGFNGKENDNEVKGEGNQQDYGLRINDPRLGRLLSLDPLAPEYPNLTPYQFAANTPIWAVDYLGAQAKIAIAGSGYPYKDAPIGQNPSPYSKSEINAFQSRAQRMAKFGYNVVTTVNSGAQVIKTMKDATSTQGGISRVVLFAHGANYGVFFNDRQNFYRGNGGPEAGRENNNYTNTNLLLGETLIEQFIGGGIRFDRGAIAIFMSCHSGKWIGKDGVVDNNSLAENVARTLLITTIGATGSVSPVNANGKETGNSLTFSDPKNNDESNPQFYMFIPKVIEKERTITVKQKKYFLGIPVGTRTIQQKEKYNEVEIERKPLGNTIDPSKY